MLQNLSPEDDVITILRNVAKYTPNESITFRNFCLQQHRSEDVISRILNKFLMWSLRYRLSFAFIFVHIVYSTPKFTWISRLT
jgi:hypothetical protein